MSEFISVTIMTASHGEAEKIGRVLVEEKLAACATIVANARSIYRWKDKIEESDEYLVIAKTLTVKFDALQRRVSDIHSYECPCIIATPIAMGNEVYLKWLKVN
jgi:periplasmic divalent cation tolerance protein